MRDEAIWLREVLKSTTFCANSLTEHCSIIRILITKWSTRGYPADRQYLNNSGPKVDPEEPPNVPVMISYHQFGLTESDHIGSLPFNIQKSF